MITREEYIAKLMTNNKQKDENWVDALKKKRGRNCQHDN